MFIDNFGEKASKNKQVDNESEKFADFMMNSGNAGPFIFEDGKLTRTHDKKDVEDIKHVLKMDSEIYSIKIVFDVAESQHNFERGNLFLMAQFNSYKQSEEPKSVSSSGFLEPKGQVALFLSDIATVVPFGNWFMSPWLLTT